MCMEICCVDRDMVSATCTFISDSVIQHPTEWCYNITRIPIGSMQSLGGIRRLVRRIRHVFFEYVRLNVTFSPSKFKGSVASFEIKYNSYTYTSTKLRSKHIRMFFKCYEEDQIFKKHAFAIEELYQSIGCEDITQPFDLKGLSFMQKHTPYIYTLLQEHDMIHTKLVHLPWDLKELLKMKHEYDDAVEGFKRVRGEDADRLLQSVEQVITFDGIERNLYNARANEIMNKYNMNMHIRVCSTGYVRIVHPFCVSC